MYGFGILRIDNTDLKASFMKWYNEKIKTLPTKLIPEAPEKRIPVPQIALKYVYEDIYITPDNMDEIAKKYEWTSKRSGKGLYDDFIHYVDKNNRIKPPEGKVKLKNKIKLFETVLELLPEGKKNKAFIEIEKLKSYLSDY